MQHIQKVINQKCVVGVSSNLEWPRISMDHTMDHTVCIMTILWSTTTILPKCIVFVGKYVWS